MTDINTPAAQTFAKINRLINSSLFNEAFLLLNSHLKKYDNLKKEADRLKDLESTYRYMLDYIADGHNDPSLNDTTEKIREGLRAANSLLFREIKQIDSSDIYSAIRRLEILHNTNFKQYYDNFVQLMQEGASDEIKDFDGEFTPQQANELDKMFNYVWTMTGNTPEDYEDISKALDNPDFPDFAKSSIISALTLGNLNTFDPLSFHILLNQFENNSSSDVRARAIVGLMLIASIYPERISGNISLRSRLMLAHGDEQFKKFADEVLLNLLRTFDTKRVDDKMRNEVIPGLMKIKPEIIDKMRNLSSDAENFLSDANPEWEELMENSDIGNKLQEINDMQMEGADVMVTAFSNLKSFPFFNQVSNWFLPFIPGNSRFNSFNFLEDPEMASRFEIVMCDSDLHSFLLSLGTMPEENRQQLFRNMENQMKEAKEALSDAIGDTDDRIISRKIRHSLQDLYRFFNFFKKKNDFENPFSNPVTIKNIEPLVPILAIEIDNIKLMAEFYFKNKYYEEALGYYLYLDKEMPGNHKLWEKIGFCYQKLHNYGQAADWYNKAEIIDPNNNWLIKKLALTLKNAGKPEQALKYYELALEQEPENYHLLMSAAQCLMNSGEYKKALKFLYHANYLQPEKRDSERAVAWAELLSGNHEKARNLYTKLINYSDADNTDFLNAAHAAMSDKDFKNALRLYTSFVKGSKNQDITNLLLAFKEDSEVLKQLEIPTRDLRLIVDKIRYDLA